MDLLEEILEPWRPDHDPIRHLEKAIRVFQKRQEALMGSVADVVQKSNDQKAALDSLSAAVDVFKSTKVGLPPADQASLDGALGVMDANAATIAAIQTKVNNP